MRFYKVGLSTHSRIEGANQNPHTMLGGGHQKGLSGKGELDEFNRGLKFPLAGKSIRRGGLHTNSKIGGLFPRMPYLHSSSAPIFETENQIYPKFPQPRFSTNFQGNGGTTIPGLGQGVGVKG